LFLDGAARAQSAPKATTPSAQTNPAAKLPATQQPPTPPPTTTPAPAPATAKLSDRAELQKVIGLIDVGKYKECADTLAELLRPDSTRPLQDSDVIENARLYHAVCLINNGQPKLADEPLRAAIRANPQMKQPDSLVFGEQLLERYLQVREAMIGEIREAERKRAAEARANALIRERELRDEQIRVRGLERLAATQTVVVKNRRWIAMVPFGVGQFQNGDKSLGWVFFGAEAALGVTALTALAYETKRIGEAAEAKAQNKDPTPINENVETWHTVLKVSSYGFLALAIGGIVEAQLSFVPEEKKTLPRPLPERLRPRPKSEVEFRPQASVTPQGFELGFAGRF
jgi:hypothetical protein